MRLHVLAGRRGEAVRQYEHLCARLADELGIEPSPKTQRLYEEIRTRTDIAPELNAGLWEGVGDLRVLSGDTAGATRAFGAAADAARPANATVRLHLKIASSLLMQHAAEEAESHLVAAERLGPDGGARVRLACLRANQAWERGRLEHAQQLAEEALKLAPYDGEVEALACPHEAVAVVSHLRGDWRRGLEVELERLAADGERGAQLGADLRSRQCIAQVRLYGDVLSDDVREVRRRRSQ